MKTFICADEVKYSTNAELKFMNESVTKHGETDCCSQLITVQQNGIMPSDRCPMH